MGGKIIKWTKEEDRILKTYYPHHSVDDMVKLLPNRSRDAIILRASIKKIKQEQNFHKESDCSVLLRETNEAGYWLGFLLADGHFSNKHRLSFRLANKDANSVKQFAKFINCKNIRQETRKDGYKYYTVSAQDRFNIKRLMEKYNIVNNKTHNPTNIRLQNTDFYLSMIVGYIDGDGCIKNQYKRKDTIIGFHVDSSWLGFLNQIVDILNSLFETSMPYGIIGNDGYARLNITNSIAIIGLRKKLSQLNIPFMKRKWNKIDINFVSRYIIAKNNRDKIMGLYNSGQRIVDISKKLKLKYSCVYAAIHRKEESYE